MGFKGPSFGTGCVYILSVPVQMPLFLAFFASEPLSWLCQASVRSFHPALKPCQALVSHLSGLHRNKETKS